MKKTIALFVLTLLMPLAAVADGYTALWKQYDEARKKDLPKSQIELLGRIAARAAAEKSYGNLLKAEVNRMVTVATVSPDSLSGAIGRLEQAADGAAETDRALAAVYSCVLSDVYANLSSMQFPDAPRLRKEYSRKALADPALLASVRTTGYEPFVRIGVDSGIFNNDLLSVIGYRLKDYALLNAWYDKAGNRRAALLTALEKVINCYRENPVKKRARGNRYLASLDSLIAVYGDLPECGEVALEKYAYMCGCSDVTAGEKAEYISSASARWAAWRNIGKLKEEYEKLVQPYFEFTFRENCLPERADSIDLLVRNIGNITIDVYRLNADGSNCPGNDGLDYEKVKKLILRQSKVTVGVPVSFAHEYDNVPLKVALPAMKPGIYYVEVTPDNAKVKTQRGVFSVSDVYVATLALPGNKVRYVVMSATTGQPLPGAKLELWSGDAKVRTTLTADSKGETVARDKANGNDAVRAYTAADNYMRPSHSWNTFNSWKNDYYRNTITLFTDRAVYRPGQTVHVSALAFSQEGLHKSRVTDGEELTFTLCDANNKTVAEKKRRTDDYGTADVDFTLPEGNIMPGRFSVRCTGNGTAYRAFRVEEYKRPTFDVKFDDVTAEYHNGDTVTVGGTAATFSGVPVAGARVAYAVSRRAANWYWAYSGRQAETEEMLTDTVVTDAKGRFQVRIPVVMPQDYDDEEADGFTGYPGRFVWQTRYRFTAVATVTDNGGESHSAETGITLGTRATELVADIPEKVLRDSVLTLTFNRYNASGKKIGGEVAYWFDNGKKYTAKANEKTVIDWTALAAEVASGRHELWATCGTDTVMRHFTLFGIGDTKPAADTPDWAYLSNTVFPRDGKPVYVQVGSSADNVHVLYSVISGDKVLESGAYDLSNAIKTIPLEYREEYGEAVLLNYLWVKEGKAYEHKFTITRPLEDKTLDMKWVTFRDRLTPGQKEKWTLNISRPDIKDVINGRNATDSANRGQLLALMYDKSLEQIVKSDFSFSLGLWQNTPFSRWRTLPDDMQRMLVASQKIKPFAMKPFDFSSFDYQLGDLYLASLDMMIGTSEVLANRPLTIRGYGRSNALMATEQVKKKEAIGAFDTRANDAYDRAVESASAPDAGNDDADGSAAATVPAVRENLQETAFFYPSLYADRNGNVDIEFTLPESVTTWTFRGFAHDKDMNFGLLESDVVASKKVMVMPNVPRFVRRGDEATVAARIANTTDSRQTALVRMQLLDPETGRVVCERKQNITIEPGTTASADFSFTAPEGAPLLVCRVAAEGKDFSDGEQHYLAVLPDRERLVNTVPFTFTGSGEKTVAMADVFPAGADSKRLTVEYTANPSWLMVQALPYISEVRHENAISISAAYYANAIGKYMMDKAPVIEKVVNLWKREKDNAGGSLVSALEKNSELKTLVLEETPWVMDADKETDRKRMLSTFFDQSAISYRLSSQLKQLKALQHSDGSWGWWPGMKGSASITAQVLQTLARLDAMTGRQQATAAMIESGMKYLGGVVMKEYEEMKRMEKEGKPFYICDSHAIQYLYINTLLGRKLSVREGEAKDYLLSCLRKDRQRDIYSKALMAVVLNAEGKQGEAREYVESIRQYTVSKPDMGTYFDTPRARYSWFDYRIPTQTAAIEALKAVEPADAETLSRMRLWLLQSKRTQAWDTPINTVNAVYAFLDGNYASLQTDKAQGVTLLLDGKEMAQPKPTAGLGYVKTALDIDRQTALTVRKTDAATSWGAVYAQFSQPAVDITDASAGISVERQVLSPANGMKPVGSNTLKVGDRIVVRITVNADRDYDFVQLVDKRAACMEPVRQTSGYEYGYYCAPKDNSTNYYFDRLSKGRHVVETEYYIDRAGSYTTGSCTVQCAYAPEFSGRTGGQRLSVEKQ